MRIKGVSDAIGLMKPVDEKADSAQFQRQRKDQDDSNSRKDPEPEIEVTDEKVNGAIEALQSDPAAQEAGIHAEIEGAGPGLRILLKDGSGGVLRRLSGEEFLKLRESTQKSDGKRGKILDQKF